MTQNCPVALNKVHDARVRVIWKYCREYGIDIEKVKFHPDFPDEMKEKYLTVLYWLRKTSAN